MLDIFGGGGNKEISLGIQQYNIVVLCWDVA